METVVLIQEIVKLPMKERFIIIEDTLKSIQEETTRERTLVEGAKALLADYLADDELTAFTALDMVKYIRGERCLPSR